MTSNNSEIPADTADAILEELCIANLIGYTAAFSETLPADVVLSLHDDISKRMKLNTTMKQSFNGLLKVKANKGGVGKS